jgi:mannan endo-1,4-beta-mannosidase
MVNLIIRDGKFQFPINDNIINDEFFRISAIQWNFPRVSYFLAWNDGWSPIRNKNAYAFYNNQRILNRGQFNTGGRTRETATSSSSSSSFLYNFSDGTAEWQGSNIAGGPWQSNELVFQSKNSLKADIQLTAGGQYALYAQQSTSKLSGRRRLRAQARTASWGFANNGYITAKLYVKAGSAWNWYDSSSVQLNGYTATEIVLDLNGIPSNQLNDIKEIGIQYESNAYGDKTSVYLSSITME